MSFLINSPDGLTDLVLRAMSQGSSDRLNTVMKSLVTHLHAFARDVNLSQNELELGLAFTNRVGQATNDSHNEAVLLSDLLGLSTLVSLLEHGGVDARDTAVALLGPFWRMNAPAVEDGGTIIRSPTSGSSLRVTGLVSDTLGVAVSDVTVDIWQASPCGLYENQDSEQAEMNLRGTMRTMHDGSFRFETVVPAGYPVPTHGPSGNLLQAQRRSPMRPAHIHFLLHKPGFKTLISQVYIDQTDAIANDVVFGVTRDLVGKLQIDADGTATLQYCFVLERGESRLPQAPIK